MAQALTDADDDLALLQAFRYLEQVHSNACDVSLFAPLHDALPSAVLVRRVLPADEVGALSTQLTSEAAAAH